MTEEQKLEWLKGLIEQGVNVAQINLGDGTQNFYVNKDGGVTAQMKNAKVIAETTIPAMLSTKEANRIWEALREKGYVDERLQVCDSSLSKQAIIAEEMSKRLFRGESIHWNLFEQLWGVKNLRTQKGKQLNDDYRKKVKEVVAVATGKIKI